MSRKLLIIGPDIETRGVGGVTIHVRRLRDYLDLNGVRYVFKDSKENCIVSILSNIAKHKIVHLHISNPVYQFILVLFGCLWRKKVIITLHGNYGRFGWFKNLCVRYSIAFATVPIVINEKSFSACRRFNHNIRLIPAFIPPQKLEYLQLDVTHLLYSLREQGLEIISTNASNYAIDKNGHEIYGIDFLIQELNGSNGFALVISDPSGKYTQKYKPIAYDNIYFINHPHPYFEVLKQVDYFVRNTSTDGDALSVKEALYLGLPTICSDVVDRPEGAKLFKYSDRESFRRCLNDKSKGGGVRIVNGAEKNLEIYNSFAK